MKSGFCDSDWFSLLGLTMTSFFWGTSYAAAKIGLREMAPMNLVSLRFILASVFFAFFLLFIKSKQPLQKKDLPRFFITGFLGTVAHFGVQYTALQYTTTIHASLIIALSPIITALLAWLFQGERLKKSQAVGMLLAFLGVYIILLGKGLEFSRETLKGDLIVMLNPVIWALFTVGSRPLSRNYGAFAATAYANIAGALLLVPFIFSPNWLMPVAFVEQIKTIHWPTWGSALYLALTCSVFGYFFYYNGLSRLGASRTSVFMYVNTVFAVIFGIFVMHEAWSVKTILGSFAVIGGVYLTSRRPVSAVANDATGRNEKQPGRNLKG